MAIAESGFAWRFNQLSKQVIRTLIRKLSPASPLIAIAFSLHTKFIEHPKRALFLNLRKELFFSRAFGRVFGLGFLKPTWDPGVPRVVFLFFVFRVGQKKKPECQETEVTLPREAGSEPLETCFLLGLSMSILDPGIRIFSGNHSKPSLETDPAFKKKDG